MATREIHFQDRRPPHEIQFVLEREMMMLLRPALEDSRLAFRASTKVNGVPYRVLLRFEAALPMTNCYVVQFEAAATDLSPTPPTGQRKNLDGWVDLWTRDFKAAAAPHTGEGSADRYRKLVEQAEAAEAHLQSVPAIQQEILKALRAGASFSTAHKEGGTNICFHRDRFVRTDYGESGLVEEFRDDAGFLAFLRKFYDWETSRNISPEKVPDYDAWKLMLRTVIPQQKPSPRAAASRMIPTITGYKVALALIVMGVAAVFVVVFGSQLFKVKTFGHPVGNFVRTKDHIAALIMTAEPHIQLSHRNPGRELQRFDLLLQPVDGQSLKRLIPIARRLPRLQYRTRMLGEDGDLLWFTAHEITGFDFKSEKVITASDRVHLTETVVFESAIVERKNSSFFPGL